MNLMWGVEPIRREAAVSSEGMVLKAERLMLKRRAVAPGDVIAIVAGTGSTTGSTNFMRLQVVGAGEK